MSFGITTFRSWRSSALAVAILGVSLFFNIAASAQVGTLTQGFDDITTLTPAGWSLQNKSAPVGSTGWFQGNPAVIPSHQGAPNSAIGANFNNTGNVGTISNWLITPHLNLANGAVFKFWTRTTDANSFPDRLQVRLSTNGASTNTGTGALGVGDFTTLLLDINPTYDDTPGPPPAQYPDVWTEITITLSGIPAGSTGRLALRYFVENGGLNGANSNFISIDTLSYVSGPTIAANGQCDYTGDGRTDYVVVRNVGGGANGQVRWFYNPSSGGATVAKDWGLSSDFFICGNWDTDANDDIAIWRPGAPTVAAFYILRSTDFTALVEPFGQTGDQPEVVADYTGDGRTDFAVYRGGAVAGDPSTWYYRSAATPGGPVTQVVWGKNGDFPCPGDYAGNASADFCVQRGNAGQGNFWILSSAGVSPVQALGTSSDLILPGDYDGDGKTDITVARGSGGAIVWNWLPSSGGGFQTRTWGQSATDFPTQGDYDGDGKTDVAIWRPSATAGQSLFWVYGSQTNSGFAFQLGQNGDYPVANFNSF